MKRKSKIAKVTAIIVSLVAFMNVGTGSIFANEKNGSELLAEVQLGMTGFVAPQSDIQGLFANELNIKTYDEVLFDGTLLIGSETIELEGNIEYDDSVAEAVKFVGTLYKSYKMDNGNISYVASLVETTNRFDVLYCEINLTKSDVALDQDLRGKKVFTLYLRDGEGNLLSFNKEIDSVDAYVNINPACVAPADIDFSWYIEILDPVQEETALAITPYSVHQATWSGSIQTVTFSIADTEHMYTACPYIDFSVGDVPKAGTGEWWMSLKISESAKYRSAGSSTWISNTSNYAKVFSVNSPQLSWTCGGNTILRSYANRSNCKGGGNGSFWGGLATIASFLPFDAPVSSILSLVDRIWSTTPSNTTISGSQGAGAGLDASTMRVVYPSKSYIDISGYGKLNYQAERFELAVFPETYNSSVGKNASTTAIAKFTFTLKWTEGFSGTTKSKSYNDSKRITYVSNMQ